MAEKMIHMAEKTIYLAGRWSRRDELRVYAAYLMWGGWTVTSRWLFSEHRAEVGDDEELMDRLAREDLEDISLAKTFVLFTEPPRTATRGGRMVELGYAMRIAEMNSKSGGIPTVNVTRNIYIVGQVENVFCATGANYVRRLESIEDFARNFGLPAEAVSAANRAAVGAGLTEAETKRQPIIAAGGMDGE